MNILPGALFCCWCIIFWFIILPSRKYKCRNWKFRRQVSMYYSLGQYKLGNSLQISWFCILVNIFTGWVWQIQFLMLMFLWLCSFIVFWGWHLWAKHICNSRNIDYRRVYPILPSNHETNCNNRHNWSSLV